MIPPDILSESEEGPLDLVLGVVADCSMPGAGRCFDVHATHEGDLVGIRVELSPEWRPGRIAGRIFGFAGTVTYRSLGDLSDRFVSLIDHLYGAGLAPMRMKDAVSFAAITLGDDPESIDSTVVNMKLFLQDAESGAYAELYTNVDLPRGVIQICEKDEEYRRVIVRALAEAMA